MTINRFRLAALSAACLLALGTGAGAMSKADLKAAASDTPARFTSDTAGCKVMTANARDVCIDEARDREKDSRAELEATFSPSERRLYDLRIAKADAAHAVAKRKCDAFAGDARTTCSLEAKALYGQSRAQAETPRRVSPQLDDARTGNPGRETHPGFASSKEPEKKSWKRWKRR